MAKGISLHIGVNNASSNFPNAPILVGCENDARAMHDLAMHQGFFKHALLLGPDATYERVEHEIRAAAAELAGGDFFLFTFAGHGCGLPDQSSPDGDEPDLQDEAILLFDYLLIDDVLERDLWPQFNPGVRILMTSDSCHSGTVNFVADTLTRVSKSVQIFLSDLAVSETTDVLVAESGNAQVRSISEETKLLHLLANMDFYERALISLPSDAAINASVLLLAACQDAETTTDDYPHGVFTQALLDVWSNGDFKGNYDDFIEGISSKLKAMNLSQTPAITPAGQTNSTFRRQRPFSIDA